MVRGCFRPQQWLRVMYWACWPSEVVANRNGSEEPSAGPTSMTRVGSLGIGLCWVEHCGWEFSQNDSHVLVRLSDAWDPVLLLISDKRPGFGMVR